MAASGNISSDTYNRNNDLKDSSDDECLANLKRKLPEGEPSKNKKKKKKSKKRKRYNNDLDLDVNVKIEVEDYDGIANDSSYEISQLPQLIEPEALIDQRRLQGDYDNSDPAIQTFLCKDCGFEFASFQDYRNHSVEHPLDERPKCKICSKIFSKECELNVHNASHTDVTPHKCDICNRSFTHRVNMERHMNIHTNNRPWKCDKCPAKFIGRRELERHSLKHNNDAFFCLVCKVKFLTKEQLDLHVNVLNHAPGYAKCYYCSEVLRTNEDKLLHIKQKHSNADNVLKCNNCENGTPCQHHIEQSNQDYNGGDVYSDLSKDRNGRLKYEGTSNCSEVKTDRYIEMAGMSDEMFKISENINEIEKTDAEINETCDSTQENNISEDFRDELTYETQCAIVNKMYKGRSIADICKLYNLSADIVNEIWDERDKIVTYRRLGRRSAQYMNSILDAKVLEWFHAKKAKNIQVTGKMLIDIAEEFAKECGFLSFDGNLKWLDKFKTRHKISLRQNHVKREPNRPNNDAKWKENFLKDVWSEARSGFADEDIYTADEVGIYYNPSKGRIRKAVGRKFIHGQMKDRLAVFMATNITGSDKKKLVVCGTDDPLCRSHRSPDTLPVTYIRHTQGHFTTPMFESLIMEWDMQLQSINRKAILILDRASIHTKMVTTNLKLVFVPWKASQGLMPIKNGIYSKFREEFRKLLLLEKTMNVMRNVDRRLTCLEAIEMLFKAWKRVPPEVIMNSFEATGFEVVNKYVHNDDVDSPRVAHDDEEVMSNWLRDYDIEPHFLELSRLDSYLIVDDEFLTGEGTNKSVFGSNHKPKQEVVTEKSDELVLPVCTEQPETNDKEKCISKARALQDIEIIRQHLQTTDTSYEHFKAFMDVEKFLLSNPLKLQPP